MSYAHCPTGKGFFAGLRPAPSKLVLSSIKLFLDKEYFF